MMRVMAGMLAAISASISNNKSMRLEASAADRIVPKRDKLPRMSPEAYFRAKAKAGHPRRHKNRLNCARMAKIKRRKAA
jgi:hypothetical protein